MGDISTYIIIRSTASYSAARETTTSVGLAHARPIINDVQAFGVIEVVCWLRP